MSKHMQLTVKVRPYYQNGLRGIYPGIADALSGLKDVGKEQDLSLFDIVKNLDKVLYELEGNQPFAEVMRKHRTDLLNLHEEIQTHMADWRLAEVDKRLYRIEDIFDDIERELSEV